MDQGKLLLMKLKTFLKNSIPDKSKVHNSLTKIMNEVDINGDGKISFIEFCRVMKRMLKKNTE